MNKWVWLMIEMLLKNMSAPFRAMMESTILEWEAKAKTTDTPADDLFVGVVKWLIGMP